jgi:hypothetical protein
VEAYALNLRDIHGVIVHVVGRDTRPGIEREGTSYESTIEKDSVDRSLSAKFVRV